MSVEGTGVVTSAGPWCITPGPGFPWGSLRWLSSGWGVGPKEHAGLGCVLACL